MSEVKPNTEVVETPVPGSQPANVQPTDNKGETLDPKLSADPAKGEQPTENKEEKVIKDPQARKFAALARQKKEFVKAQEDFKKEKQELERVKNIIEENKKNPIKVLEALGWDYEALTDYILNEKVPQKVEKSETDKRIERLEQERADEKRALEEKQFNDQLNTFKQHTKGYVNAHSQELELLAQEEDPGQLVYDYINAIYEQSGKSIQLTVEEAAKELESFFQEEQDKLWEKLSKREKFKKMLATDSSKESSSEDKDKEATTVKKGPQTLTSDLNSAPTPAGRKLSREESLKQAAQKLKSLM